MFQKMKISDYIKKPLWYRNVYTKGSEAPQTVLNNAFVPSYPMTLDKSKKQILSQTNFLNELSPSAHEIYSTTIRSLRPKYRYDKPTQKLVLNGYEEVERIAMPFESSIRENKTAYCFGNEIWFGNEGGEATAEKMSRFKSWWNSANMKACISSMGSHLFGTADAAVALYIEDGEIKGLAPDWVKTKQLWDSDTEAKENKQLVYHFNEETNGIRYKFSWSKNRVLVSNKTLYNLRMTRSNKRELSKLVREGKEYLIKD